MNQGFTLIELLVVVLIIGILSAVALPQYQTAVERARATEALTQMSAISESLQRYRSQHEAWPIANRFNKLDVDIPSVTACTSGFGGKHFCLSFVGTNATSETNATATIEAVRQRTSGKYTLTSTITENDNGTFTVTRTCTPAAANDSDATAYCNAISGGNTNF